MNHHSPTSFSLAAACGRPIPEQNSYKTMTAISQTDFSVLAKIVNTLKARYLTGDKDPVTLTDILFELHLTEISRKQREWLLGALANNPKIRVIDFEDNATKIIKYQFKPVLDISNGKSLVRYLAERYEAGQGALSIEDIQESLPKADKIIKLLLDKDIITVITRQSDKKKYVFYNDGRSDIKIDEEFVKLWRSVPVDGVPDEKIEEYLEKHGIQSIRDLASKKIEPIQKRRKVGRRQNKNFKAHNEHMKDILEDYAEK